MMIDDNFCGSKLVSTIWEVSWVWIWIGRSGCFCRIPSTSIFADFGFNSPAMSYHDDTSIHKYNMKIETNSFLWIRSRISSLPYLDAKYMCSCFYEIIGQIQIIFEIIFSFLRVRNISGVRYRCFNDTTSVSNSFHAKI